MKKLSLLEFKDYVSCMSMNTFIFSTDNQQWHNIDSTISLELCFKEMFITFSPNSIFFTGSRNTSLRLDRVKAVKIQGTQCALGLVFTVVCGEMNTKEQDKEYTLIGR